MVMQTDAARSCIITKGTPRGRDVATGRTDLIEDIDSTTIHENRGIAAIRTSTEIRLRAKMIGCYLAEAAEKSCASSSGTDPTGHLRKTTPTEGCEMSASILRWTMIVTFLCMWACGCSYFQSATNDDDIDLTEVDEEEPVEPAENTETVDRTQFSPSQRSSLTATESETKLAVGNRFPFSKSVEHRLTQVDQDGTRVSSSRTDMNLTISVERVLADGRRLMTIQFQRVQHVQDILGKRISYSSDAPGSSSIPQDAALYAGLTNNGFSFWMGANNQILEVVGYGDFLRQCLRNARNCHEQSSSSNSTR